MPETGSKEIGQYFFNSCLLFFLKTGTTLAFFHSEGNFPFSKHDRKIMPSGLQIDSSQILTFECLSYHDRELYLG